MTADYFAALNLPRIFDIDLAVLEKNYFAAQRTSHPDRLIGKNAVERQQAISHSMLLNESYEALKEPLSRAQHLLALADVAPDSVKPGPELLMEVMESRESLSDADTPDKIEAIEQNNGMEIAGLFAELTQAFKIPDLEEAAKLTMRLSYLKKLEDEIRIRKKSL